MHEEKRWVGANLTACDYAFVGAAAAAAGMSVAEWASWALTAAAVRELREFLPEYAIMLDDLREEVGK